MSVARWWKPLVVVVALVVALLVVDIGGEDRAVPPTASQSQAARITSCGIDPRFGFGGATVAYTNESDGSQRKVIAEIALTDQDGQEAGTVKAVFDDVPASGDAEAEVQWPATSETTAVTCRVVGVTVTD